MNTPKILLSALIAMMLTSCVSTSYYQVYRAVPSDKLIVKDNLLIYEDDNCKLSYNLWDEGGNVGFNFFNKTDKNIYLNLDESFFVLNGVAYNYYKNRVFTSSTNSGTTSSKGTTSSRALTGLNYLGLLQTNKISATNYVGNITSSGYSVSFNEEKQICIPPKTVKIISEYTINESLIRDCYLFKYPTKKQIKTLTFSKDQSPLVFSNRIAYSLGSKTDNLIKFENEFYVTEISNYPESVLFKSNYVEYCGQKSMTMTNYFKKVADKFYIKYNKGQDTWKH